MAIEWYSRVNILFMMLCILASLLYFILWRREIISSGLKLIFSIFIFFHEIIKLFAILLWYANFVELHILQIKEMVLAERLYTILENGLSIYFFIILIFFIKEALPSLNEININFKNIINGYKNDK